MRYDRLEFLAVQVDELTAFFAFAVETDLWIGVALRAYVFIAGGACAVEIVLVYNALVHELLKVTVDRGLTYRRSERPEILADVARGDMHARDGREV